MVMSPAGHGPENGCVNDTAILSSERMLHKDYDRKCSVEKNTGRESERACRQDKLIGGKPPVIK
jgi:hypothetical protein